MIKTHFFCGSLSLLGAILETLKVKYPILTEFLFIKKHSIPSFKAEGVNYILKETCQRKYDPIDPVVTCSLMAVPEQIETFYRSERIHGIILVTIQHEQQPHFLPLILERKGDTIHILSTDSVYDKNDDYTYELLTQAHAAQCKKEFYCIPFQRQSDRVSCSVFALTDCFFALKSWKENPQESLIDSIKQKQASLATFSWGPLFYQVLDHYPTHMLRTTHSLSKTASHAHECFQHKNTWCSLSTHLKEHTYVYASPTRYDPFFQPSNLTTSQKLITYIEHILRHYVV